MIDFPVSLQFLGISLSQWPYIVAAVFTIVIVFIIYKFRLAPTIEYPLANEEDLGIGKISLPQLGKLNEGRMTTARRYVQGLWAKLITSAEKDAQENLIKLRDLMLSGFLIAQRVGRDKIIYVFDANPIDPQYHVREDHGRGTTPVRWIGPVQDSMSLGSFDGFEFIHGKLKTEQFHFTEDERIKWSAVLEALKFLRLSAMNTEASNQFKTERDSYKELANKSAEDAATERSEKERAKRALKQKSLTSSEPTDMKGAWFKGKVKFFTPGQIALSLGSFVFMTNIIQAFGVEVPNPVTVGVILALVMFFMYPFLRGLFKR